MLAHSHKTISVLALLASLLIAGCGSSGDSTASPLTKAQFIKKADAVCEAADRAVVAAMSKVGKESGGKEGPSQQRALVVAAMAPIQKEAEEIAGLGVPNGDEAVIAAIVAGIEEGIDKAEADPAGASAGDFAKASKLAAKYGFKACAEPL